MAKDRATDGRDGAERVSSPIPRTRMVRAPIASDSDDPEDNFRPGAPTRMQPTPVHTEARNAAFFDSDEETVTGFAGNATEGVPARAPTSDALPEEGEDVEVDLDVDVVEMRAATNVRAPMVFDEVAPIDAEAAADAPNPFRDAPTQVDLESLPDDNAYAVSGEGDEDDTDSHAQVLAQKHAPAAAPEVPEFIDAAMTEGEGDISDLPTASHARPPIEPDPNEEDPIVDAGGVPIEDEGEGATAATVLPEAPMSEVEEGPVDVQKWRVVPTGWEAQPSYYSPRVPEPPRAAGPQKVHTVMWNAGDEPAGDAMPLAGAPSSSEQPGRFAAATGARQLASVYVNDALRALDDIPTLTAGLDPEARRALHAGLSGVAQKLRRALSLLDDGQGPSDASTGHDEE